MKSHEQQNQNNESALYGVNVLDLSEDIAGPFAARLLGDFGANVIKIERPERGDPQRYKGPLFEQAREGEQSLLFQYLNWNKKSIVLDITDASKTRVFRQLVERSDIVVESFTPGELDSWGIGIDKLLEWNPKLVLVSISNFGQTGPYAKFKANDLILQAMSGMMQISGSVEREPLRQGLSQTYYCAGLNAAYAALAAYLAAERDGVGDHVDVSILECLSSELVYNQPFYTFMGAIQGRRAAVQDPFDGEPIKARNGYVSVQAGGGAPFHKFADLLNLPELADPKYATPKLRTTCSVDLHEMLSSRFSEMDPHQIFVEAAKNRLLMGVVQNANDLLACPHLEARDFYKDIHHPETGTFKFPAELAKLSKTRTRINFRAPMLNEHESEILNDMGL